LFYALLERWTLEELSGVMHVPPGLLRRRLGFWISQGVLKEESTDTFTVVEKQKGQQRIPGNVYAYGHDILALRMATEVLSLDDISRAVYLEKFM